MQMSPANHSSRPALAAVLMLAAAGCAYAEERGREMAPLIEVFTTAQNPIQEHTAPDAPHESRGHYTRYDIDHISLLQQALSHGLPPEPAHAKQQVLQRLQVMDASLSQPLENAGRGLAQAMAYGIDRLPAVVFDGRAVVYGVTDIDEALAQYHRWCQRGGR